MRLSLILGAVLAGLALLAAGLSYVWTPGDVTQIAIAQKLQAPSAAHWLGTDQLGRDMLAMVMVGARLSIAVALVAVGIGMGVGVPLGLWAAARSGSWLDEVIMRGNDLVFAFPSLVIAILITAAFGPSALNGSSPSASSISRSLRGSRAARHCRSGRWTISAPPVWPARGQRGSACTMCCPISPTC